MSDGSKLRLVEENPTTYPRDARAQPYEYRGRKRSMPLSPLWETLVGTSPPHLPSDSVPRRDGSGAGKKRSTARLRKTYGKAASKARNGARSGNRQRATTGTSEGTVVAVNSRGERDEDAVVDDDEVDAASKRVARGKRLPSETNDSLDFSVARSISCNTCNDDNDNNDCNNDG